MTIVACLVISNPKNCTYASGDTQQFSVAQSIGKKSILFFITIALRIEALSSKIPIQTGFGHLYIVLIDSER